MPSPQALNEGPRPHTTTGSPTQYDESFSTRCLTVRTASPIPHASARLPPLRLSSPIRCPPTDEALDSDRTQPTIRDALHRALRASVLEALEHLHEISVRLLCLLARN